MDPHEQQQQFARMMEETMRNALAATDAATAQARAEREAATAEREAAQEARREIERNADKIAASYLDARREELVEFARTELLRRLARQHLQAGEAAGSIARWLDVPPAFIDEIAEVLARVEAIPRGQSGKPKREVPPGNPRLRYENQGRGGTIWYESEEARFSLWWEFAGRDALAIIQAPDVKHWEAHTGLPADRRGEVLRFIAQQALEDQTTSGHGSFAIGESVVTLYA